MNSPCTTRLPAALFFVATFLTPGMATSQPAAPSQYEEAIENPTNLGGEETEIDAAAAQVAATRDSDLTPATRQRIEEIVVSARKREELLESTPISVSALSETLLEEANITRTPARCTGARLP